MAENNDIPPIPLPPSGGAVPPVEPAPVTPPAAAVPTPPAFPTGAPQPLPPVAVPRPDPYAQPGAYAAPPPGYAQPQPGYQQAPPAYGQPGYAYQPVAAGPAQGLSLASMITGIAAVLLSFAGFGFLPAVAAVILGHIAQRRQPYARALWITGLITGYVALGISLITGIVALVFFIAAFSSSGYYGY